MKMSKELRKRMKEIVKEIDRAILKTVLEGIKVKERVREEKRCYGCYAIGEGSYDCRFNNHCRKYETTLATREYGEGNDSDIVRIAKCMKEKGKVTSW